MPFRAVPGRQRQARWGRELSGPRGSGVPAPGAEPPCRGEAQKAVAFQCSARGQVGRPETARPSRFSGSGLGHI